MQFRTQTEPPSRPEAERLGARSKFDAAALSPDTQAAFEAGIADAWVEFEEAKVMAATAEFNSSDAFGSRAELRNNCL